MHMCPCDDYHDDEDGDVDTIVQNNITIMMREITNMRINIYSIIYYITIEPIGAALLTSFYFLYKKG